MGFEKSEIIFIKEELRKFKFMTQYFEFGPTLGGKELKAFREKKRLMKMYFGILEELYLSGFEICPRLLWDEALKNSFKKFMDYDEKDIKAYLKTKAIVVYEENEEDEVFVISTLIKDFIIMGLSKEEGGKAPYILKVMDEFFQDFAKPFLEAVKESNIQAKDVKFNIDLHERVNTINFDDDHLHTDTPSFMGGQNVYR